MQRTLAPEAPVDGRPRQFFAKMERMRRQGDRRWRLLLVKPALTPTHSLATKILTSQEGIREELLKKRERDKKF